MFGRLLLLFIITPIIELAVLIKLGEVMGFTATLGLVICTGTLGAWLARSQGMRVIRRFQECAQRGEFPADPVLEGLMIVAGGALLLTPGVITDVIGFAVVAPFTRKFFREIIKKKLRESVSFSGSMPGVGEFHYTQTGSGAGFSDAAKNGKQDDDDIIDV